jgi:cytidylate kinase
MYKNENSEICLKPTISVRYGKIQTRTGMKRNASEQLINNYSKNNSKKYVDAQL